MRGFLRLVVPHKEGWDYRRSMTLHIIRDSGLKGVEDAVKQGILPVAILGAFVSGYTVTQESPVEEQGLRWRILGSL